MNYTEKFKQLARLYATTEIEFPHLKAVTLAQWMLESGRGNSFLAEKHNNFGGMMWRLECGVWNLGLTPIPYTSPSDNITTHYISCPSLFAWIMCYWRFIDRAPYKGWRNKVRTGYSYLAFIKECGYAADPDYVDKVLALLPEASELLYSLKDDTHSEGESMDITWWKINQDDPSDVRGMNVGKEVAWLNTNCSAEVLAKNLMDNLKTAKTYKVGKFDKPRPTPEPKPEPKPTPTGKRVLLDPGHSEQHTGARGKNANVQEEDLNRFQAQQLKKELEAIGVAADIYDPLSDDLFAIGQKANGYDAFVSLHLNAFKGQEFYTCAMCHPGKQTASGKSAQTASKWAQAIAKEIGNNCFSGTSGWPKGVMATGLSVLSGVATTNCPIFFLSEAEFIDDETTDGPIKERLTRAMKVGAKVLKDALT
jgi:N-acetylmuramoyl-L-alanine amidase